MKTAIRCYTITLLLVIALAAAGPSQGGIFNIDEEAELSMGKDASQQIESLYPVVRDPRLQDMINDIGLQIARVSERPNLQWEFKVLDIPDVNALSVPGHVYINKGLIDLVHRDRDEIAAVIAHEIAHTTRRHAAKQIEKEIYYSLALSMFKGGIAQYGSLAANLALLGYSRKDEYDADKHAALYMSRAGFNLDALPRFFKRLQIHDPEKPSEFETYFRTHPPTDSRIARVEKEIQALRVRTQQPAGYGAGVHRHGNMYQYPHRR
jgi:predicted Zn-dependent protease